MKNIKKVSDYVIAYGSWVASILLWLVYMLFSRTALLGLLHMYYIQNRFSRGNITQFIDRAYMLTVGVIWVALMVVAEHYFRVGLQKNQLYQRIGKVLGAEVVLIFLVDLVLAFLIGFDLLPVNRWLQLLAELVVAAGLIWLANRPPTPMPSSELQVK